MANHFAMAVELSTLNDSLHQKDKSQLSDLEQILFYRNILRVSLALVLEFLSHYFD